MTESQPNSIQQTLVSAWYKPRSWVLLLAPLAGLFRLIAGLRRHFLQRLYQGRGLALPLAIIGNITVGGSGKTPLIIELVRVLSNRGYRVGVISRGYGGKASSYPLEVKVDTPVEHCGDEPLLIKQKLDQFDCSVVVDANRSRAADYVIAQCDCDLILSDDGMQHYKLHRDAEIAVVDSARGFGNGWCLPAGPLREPINRLNDVDFILFNGSFKQFQNHKSTYHFSMEPVAFRQLATGKVVPASAWALSSEVHAVAAIGNPQRFAKSLESLGLKVILHAVDDHKPLSKDDLKFSDTLPVIITEKDAVKLDTVDAEHIWVLEVAISLKSQFVDSFLDCINLTPNKGS